MKIIKSDTGFVRNFIKVKGKIDRYIRKIISKIPYLCTKNNVRRQLTNKFRKPAFLVELVALKLLLVSWWCCCFRRFQNKIIFLDSI